MATPRRFGEIPDYPVGSLFDNRAKLPASGAHRPPVAGISGSKLDGSDSIVLNGGYLDDIDEGNYIIYTGHGGQNNSHRQIRDQELTASGNWALKISFEERIPIRVIREPRGDHRWSPLGSNTIYRYDRLYLIERYWPERGTDGYRIWRYRLESMNQSMPMGPKSELPVRRQTVLSDRPIRNTLLAQTLKQQYNFTCQICNTRLNSPSGPYAEAAHIKPLGRPDNGPDSKSNMLCLCPNHHKLLDCGGIIINEQRQIIQLPDHQNMGVLNLMREHVINT